MKLNFRMMCIGIILATLTGCAMTLKMDPPEKPDLSHIKKLHYTAGLYFSDELKAYQYKVATSPFDALAYPLGDQTVKIFEKYTSEVFEKVIFLDAVSPAEGVDMIIKPSIVKFNAVIPNPAYNPYTATMVYRAEVFNPDGEKIFTQTATGDAQTSKGLMSGFSARSICADVAQKAMINAAKQIVEGIADAEELAHLN